MVPESPYYLMEKGNLQASIKSLCWLRGAPSEDLIAEEIKEVLAINYFHKYDLEIAICS